MICHMGHPGVCACLITGTSTGTYTGASMASARVSRSHCAAKSLLRERVLHRSLSGCVLTVNGCTVTVTVNGCTVTVTVNGCSGTASASGAGTASASGAGTASASVPGCRDAVTPDAGMQ